MILFILIFNLVCGEVFSFCDQDFRVPLSKFEKNGLNANYYNNAFRQENIFAENGTLWGCICNEKICIRKCCDKFESFTGEKCEKTEGNNEFNIYLNKSGFKNTTSYHIVYSDVQCNDKDNLFKIPLDVFQLFQSGSVLIEESNETYDVYNYCIETFSTSEGNRVVVFLCAPMDGITESSIEVVNIGKIFLNKQLRKKFLWVFCVWSIY